MLIGGEAREAADGRWIVIENPAKRGSRIAEVPRGNEQDVDAAVRIAHEAFLSWRKVAPRERGRLICRIADAIEEEIEVIAQTIALETGNAIRPQSRPETKSTVDIFRYFGGVASELKGEVVPLGEELLVYTRREPFGVVGGIVSWNALCSLRL
jgi:acyl-CoA reductase-like NAD-dependent aldehyde dehydrogenase